MIVNISSCIRKLAEIRTSSPEVRGRNPNTVEIFLFMLEQMNTKHSEDILTLFAVRMLGKSLGYAIFRAYQDIAACISTEDTKLDSLCIEGWVCDSQCLRIWDV